MASVSLGPRSSFGTGVGTLDNRIKEVFNIASARRQHGDLITYLGRYFGTRLTSTLADHQKTALPVVGTSLALHRFTIPSAPCSQVGGYKFMI